ncbi:MAG: hypothetical protein QOK14_1144 [Frankiaceae bacterium]|nr:hypothetical protein [Frankiaceae bacterium]
MTERVDEIRMAPGELVAGRYRLLAPARDGDASNTLWRAEDDILGREVAVRLVCGAPARLAELHAAATRAGRLVHDGVAAIYDTGAAGNCVYIVREWVPGESLQSMLGAGPLDAQMVAELGVQLADVLSAVASAGLRHRRLHLRNVIVTPNGGVKITDLETADALDARHAPEARWFGAILYGALTARWPYPLLPAPAGLQEAVTGDDGRPASPTRLRAGIPSVLDAVAMRALTAPESGRAATDPGEIRALAEPLKKLPRSAPASDFVEEPAPPPYQPPIAPGRRRAWFAVAASIVAVIVVLLWVAARITGPTGPIPFFQARDDPQRARATTKAASASASASAAKPPAIVAVHDYDPFGNDGSEDPGRVGLTFNGNPDDGWSTDGYKAPLSLIGKKGVGVVVDLGRDASPHEVSVLFDQPGTTWDLRTADAPVPDFATTKEVAAGSVGAATSTATVPNGVSSRYWVIWLTELPQNGDGTFRAQIREIAFR